MSTRIEKLRSQLDQAKARLQAAEAREREKTRKLDTRRKIVAGAVVLAHAEKDAAFADALHGLLDRFVTSDKDRALFDFMADADTPSKTFNEQRQ